MCHVTTGKGKEIAAVAAAVETEPAAPPEPVIEPPETIYMQIVDFLLDTKATPVKHSVLSPVHAGDYSRRKRLTTTVAEFSDSRRKRRNRQQLPNLATIVWTGL